MLFYRHVISENVSFPRLLLKTIRVRPNIFFEHSRITEKHNTVNKAFVHVCGHVHLAVSGIKRKLGPNLRRVRPSSPLNASLQQIRDLKIRDATAFGTRWSVTGLGRERRSDRGKIIIKMLDARTRQRR